jgi:2-polyprenyl-3-methyl-5-hydroxy-6-metoxy-1,4-benzoquinol methylase
MTTTTKAPQAQFATRPICINCGGSNLREVSTGLFTEGALHEFLASDPWGENPLPHLQNQRWSFVACNICEQTFHAHILNPEWSEVHFSRWMSAEAIAEFARQYGDSFARAVHYTKHVLQLASLIEARPIRLLDFGCGNGEFLAICRQFGFDAVGVDRSTARRDAAGVDVLASLEELGDRTFHVITLFEVLEHLDDPRGMLKALRPYLGTGGILVLETPDCTGVTGIRTRHDYNCIHPLEHINGFTPATLRSIATRVGFEPIRAPVSHVTCSPIKAVKTEARRVLAPLLGERTQQYFRLPG